MDFFTKYKYIIYISVITIIVIVFGLIYSVIIENDPVAIETTATAVSTVETTRSEESKTIVIYISGEVNNPDTYELPKGSRVKDAVEAAGGLTEHADLNRINLAAFLSDAEHINILNETDDYAPTASVNTDNGKININTAAKEELMTLNGIGETIAAEIILYRETNGLFQKIEDIKNVKRIGDKTFEKFKDNITVE